MTSFNLQLLLLNGTSFSQFEIMSMKKKKHFCVFLKGSIRFKRKGKTDIGNEN